MQAENRTLKRPVADRRAQLFRLRLPSLDVELHSAVRQRLGLDAQRLEQPGAHQIAEHLVELVRVVKLAVQFAETVFEKAVPQPVEAADFDAVESIEATRFDVKFDRHDAVFCRVGRVAFDGDLRIEITALFVKINHRALHVRHLEMRV